MKIRNGFISNSSSTAFLLFFSDKVKTVEQLHEILFNGEHKDLVISTWREEDEIYSSMELANFIFSNMKCLSDLSMDELKNKIGSYSENVPLVSSYDYFNMYESLANKTLKKILSDKTEAIIDSINDGIIENSIAVMGNNLYEIELGNDAGSGLYTILEYSIEDVGLLDNIYYISESHH